MNTKLATTQIRIQQWASIIRDRQESGLKVDDYCEQHNLSRNAYYYWLRRVKEAALCQAGFIEVTAEEAPAAITKPSVFVPQLSLSVNGIEIDICQNTPMELLSQVIGVIRHAE